MDYVIVWFILAGGFGYIEPLRVYKAACGLEGALVGVSVDRAVNPMFVLWPDPYTAGRHCRVDIRKEINALAPGEYHIATTEVAKAGGAPFAGIDPHTSAPWRRVLAGAIPKTPAGLRVIKP